MTTRREHPTHSTGAHRAHRGARRAAARPPAHFDPCLDGLFTYCLSVMCEHDAATAALAEALAVAERQRERGRMPVDTALHRPWLYAMARWACLRRLADRQRRPERSGHLHVSGPAATQRHRELAALAWPEAVGTSPEQREALELAVRHQLPVHEIAAILNTDSETAGILLASGACEVERTRTALAVVDRSDCRTVVRLAGDHEVFLGSTLRRELVRHVDECGDCRRTAERALAGGPWPGTAPAATGALAVLVAPRPTVHAATVTALRARAQHTPRFDRRGFPAEVRDRSERRERMRSRAVTTTVVATVVAAPVLALWAAYRGAPLIGEAPGRASVSASDPDDAATAANGHPYKNAGRAGRPGEPGETSPVKVEVGAPGEPEASSSEGTGSHGPGPSTRNGRPVIDGTGPGRLTVEARPWGDATLITLSASGSRAVAWSASTDAHWLRLSRTGGTLRPGESVTVTVTVDRSVEPSGAWYARIMIAPSGAVMNFQGRGPDTPPQPPPSDPLPSQEPSSSPDSGPTGDPSPDPASSTGSPDSSSARTG